ncbi:MAG: flagellin N-terminal helical domain-containing protein [Planctomycetota bacterium]|jgi:flagellin
MGLRINSNINSLIAIRHMSRAHDSQAKAIERIASGLRIHSAADDPSGLVISNMLLGQLAGISQGIENSERALNTIQTADSALGEVVNLLNEIRTSSLAAVGATPSIVAGEQAAVDSAISAIDRIAATTRFGDQHLLSGPSSLRTTSVGANIDKLELNSIQFYGASSFTYNISVTQQPYPERATLVNVGAGTSCQIEITGAKGSEIITVAGGTTIAQLVPAINGVRDLTGVYASGGAGYAEVMGSDSICKISKVGGDATFNPTPWAGVDIEISFNGSVYQGVGREVNIANPIFQGSVLFSRNVTTGTNTSFAVDNSGLNFQLGGEVNSADTLNVGLPNTRSRLLGIPEYSISGKTYGGFLDSIRSGATNDLYTNPENAVQIVDKALEEVLQYRAHMGGVAAFNIEPGINSLQTQFVEVSDAVSNIRDTDYAIETANLLRSQILLEAGVAVLSQATLVPTSVLDLIRI